MKKWFILIGLIFLGIAIFYTLVLIRDVPRHGSVVNEGSTMGVAGADFDIAPYLNSCHHFEGYFILKEGKAKWYLTKVVE